MRVCSSWDLLTQVCKICGHLGQSFTFTQSCHFRDWLEHHLVFGHLMKLEVERTLRSRRFFSLHFVGSFALRLKLLLRFQILHAIKFIERGLFLDLSKLSSGGAAWTVALFSYCLWMLRRGWPTSVLIRRLLISWRSLPLSILWKVLLVDLILNFRSGHNLFLFLGFNILLQLCCEETWTQLPVLRGLYGSARLGHSRWRVLGWSFSLLSYRPAIHVLSTLSLEIRSYVGSMVNDSNRLLIFALLWFWSLIQNSGLVREDLSGLFLVLIEKDWSLAEVLLLEACLYGWTLHRLALRLGNLGHCDWLWLGRALLNSLNLVWLDRWAWWSIWLCRLINLNVLHVAALFLNFRMTLQVHSARKLLKRQLSVERCVVVARIQAACTKTSLSEKLLAQRLVKLRNIFFLAWRTRRIFPLWLDSMLRFVFLVEVLCLLGLLAQRLIPFGLGNVQIDPFLYFCDHLTKRESRLS